MVVTILKVSDNDGFGCKRRMKCGGEWGGVCDVSLWLMEDGGSSGKGEELRGFGVDDSCHNSNLSYLFFSRCITLSSHCIKHDHFI